jgi:hypothetical protein
MRNMMLAHIFKITLCLEGEKKAGLGLRRRILQAFCQPRCPPFAGLFQKIVDQINDLRRTHDVHHNIVQSMAKRYTVQGTET